MKAISICNPWTWYIIHGWKLLENRTWASRHEGLLLIQCSQRILAADRTEAQRMAMAAGYTGVMPSLAELQAMCGKIVGQVTQVGCVTQHASPFFAGPYAHVYENPILYRNPVKWRGEQGIFNVPDHVVAEATRGAAPAGAGDLFAGGL